jgi:hypothetical protein
VDRRSVHLPVLSSVISTAFLLIWTSLHLPASSFELGDRDPASGVVRVLDLSAVETLSRPWSGVLDVVWSGSDQGDYPWVVDMWKPFLNSLRARCPGVKIIHDKFHIIQHLLEAL